MFRFFFHSVIAIFAFNSYAFVIPQIPADVVFVKSDKDLSFENIPKVMKQISPAKNKTERDQIKKQCQDWAIQQIQSMQVPVFRVWCEYETDVVMRQYNISGNILIKNWK
jgi:hypothetical protein